MPVAKSWRKVQKKERTGSKQVHPTKTKSIGVDI